MRIEVNFTEMSVHLNSRRHNSECNIPDKCRMLAHVKSRDQNESAPLIAGRALINVSTDLHLKFNHNEIIKSIPEMEAGSIGYLKHVRVMPTG